MKKIAGKKRNEKPGQLSPTGLLYYRCITRTSKSCAMSDLPVLRTLALRGGIGESGATFVSSISAANSFPELPQYSPLSDDAFRDTMKRLLRDAIEATKAVTTAQWVVYSIRLEP